MMRNKSVTILLLILTSVTAIASNMFESLSWFTLLIIGLSGVKFLLVAFQFMELKKAHTAWKVGVIGFIIFFTGLVSVLLV